MITRYLAGLPFATIEIDGLEIECLVDTGFDGSLALPEEEVSRLGLQRMSAAEYITADGGTSETYTYIGRMVWFNKVIPVQVIAVQSDIGLVGMRLLSSATTVMKPSKGVLRISAAYSKVH